MVFIVYNYSRDVSFSLCISSLEELDKHHTENRRFCRLEVQSRRNKHP